MAVAYSVSECQDFQDSFVFTSNDSGTLSLKERNRWIVEIFFHVENTISHQSREKAIKSVATLGKFQSHREKKCQTIKKISFLRKRCKELGGGGAASWERKEQQLSLVRLPSQAQHPRHILLPLPLFSTFVDS